MDLDSTRKRAKEKSDIPPGDEHNRCREALANEGANVNLPDEDGVTPLMFAVIIKDHVECVNELIKRGADVNVPDKEDGETLFRFAVKRNYIVRKK